MLGLVLLGVAALLIAVAVLTLKYGAKGEAEAVKLSDYAKNDYKKVESTVKEEVSDVKIVAKNVKALL